MAGSNSPFSASGGISSLLKSSQNIQSKIQDFEDAVIAYEWDNSAKTYEDFLTYSNFLDSRRNSITDPMKQLSYTKKIDSARSGYISNAIQRASIDVIEGGSSNTEKYNRMTDLYYQAAEAGQYDLAQSLRLQLDNLSVTIQNEQKAYASENKAAISENNRLLKAQVEDSIDVLKDNANYAIQQFNQLGPSKFEQAAGSDLFTMLAGMYNSDDPNNPGLAQLYQQVVDNSSNPTDVRSFQKKLAGLENEAVFELPGAGKVSYKDIQDQAYASSIGQTLFDTVQTGRGVEFKRNQTTGFQYGRDEKGEYKLMPIYNSKGDFTSQTPSGKKDKRGNDIMRSYTELLKEAGFTVTGEGTNLTVRNSSNMPGVAAPFSKAGILEGQQVQLYVDASGNLQFINGDKAYNVGFDPKTGQYTGLQEQTPNPITLLPSGNELYSKFSNRYTSTLDLNNLNAGTIGVIDTTSKFARPGAPGTLLAQGAARQLQISQAKAAQAAAALPAAPAISAQPQSPVNVMAAPRNTTIALPKPKPLPNLTVNNAPNTQTVRVNNAPNNQTVKVNNKVSNSLW